MSNPRTWDRVQTRGPPVREPRLWTACPEEAVKIKIWGFYHEDTPGHTDRAFVSLLTLSSGSPGSIGVEGGRVLASFHK